MSLLWLQGDWQDCGGGSSEESLNHYDLSKGSRGGEEILAGRCADRIRPFQMAHISIRYVLVPCTTEKCFEAHVPGISRPDSTRGRSDHSSIFECSARPWEGKIIREKEELSTARRHICNMSK
jgi:hypothetical protein